MGEFISNWNIENSNAIFPLQADLDNIIINYDIKNTIMKKIILLFCIISVVSFTTSCSVGDGIRPEEKVEKLTNDFYKYAMEGLTDSIKVLYPTFDSDLMVIKCDSFSIKEIKQLEDSCYTVRITQNFSEDNTINNNKKTNIDLIFSAVDSVKNGYIITDSKGYFENEEKMYYMGECGSIDINKKLSDMEYLKRLKITDTIYYNRAVEIAQILNNNVQIGFRTLDVLGEELFFVNATNDYVNFILTNPTDYSCCGFTVNITLVNMIESSAKAELVGEYNQDDARLDSNSKQSYTLRFDHNKVFKNPGNAVNTLVQKASFHITPEAVLNNTTLTFSGNEYTEYINKKK